MTRTREALLEIARTLYWFAIIIGGLWTAGALVGIFDLGRGMIAGPCG